MANDHGKHSGAGRLRVYHLALEFCEEFDRLLPTIRCSTVLRNQLGRAMESVLLNIAEGAAHFSPGRKVYHYQIAHGSMSETLAIIARLRAHNPAVDLTRLRYRGEMVSVLLVPLIKSVNARS